jgi:hypothetical protein
MAARILAARRLSDVAAFRAQSIRHPYSAGLSPFPVHELIYDETDLIELRLIYCTDRQGWIAPCTKREHDVFISLRSS